MNRGFQAAIILFVFLMGHGSFAAQDESEFNQWRYQTGGEERLRYEYRKNFDFNQRQKDNGGRFYHRLRLGFAASLTDEYLKPKAEIFVEALDAQTGGYQIPRDPSQADDFDLHQGYLTLRDILGSNFDIKVGRLELKYGKGRLIAAPTWANRVRAFDGGVLHYQDHGLWADLIYGRDVKYDDGNFNKSLSDEFLIGIYGGYQQHKMTPLIEAYFLNLKDRKETNDIQRYTVGARLQADIAQSTLLDIEFPYQFGHAGSTTSAEQDISAYAFHAGITKNWEAAQWKPRLAISYDEATGDKDPKDDTTNTFIPLYQTTHEPYGLLDFFRWQNMRNPEISLTVSPTDRLQITPQADFFWLQSKFDSWYNASGGKVRTKTGGDRGYYVGNELSLRVHYDFTQNLKGESGYAHFFPGGYVEDSGAHDDVDWFYFQTAFKILKGEIPC